MIYKTDGDRFSIIEVPAGYKLVACNYCGFTFDACHTTEGKENEYDCPLCDDSERET